MTEASPPSEAANHAIPFSPCPKGISRRKLVVLASGIVANFRVKERSRVFQTQVSGFTWRYCRSRSMGLSILVAGEKAILISTEAKVGTRSG